MKAEGIIRALKKLGFEKDLKSRLSYQVYTCGNWIVSFEFDTPYMWIWFENGSKLVRCRVKSNKESVMKIKQLGKLMEKTA